MLGARAAGAALCGRRLCRGGGRNMSLDPSSLMPMIGASGAISALVGAYALSFGQPKRIVSSLRLNRWLNVAWLLAAWVVLQWMIGYLMGQQGVLLAHRRAYRRVHRRAAAAAAAAAVALPQGLDRLRRASLGSPARAGGGGGRRHISSRHRRRCAGPRRARLPRPRHSCRTGRPGRSLEVDEVEALRVLDPPAEYQMKLAHGRPASSKITACEPAVERPSVRRGPRSTRGLGRGLERVGRAVDDRADVSPPASRVRPSSSSRACAGFLGGARPRRWPCPLMRSVDRAEQFASRGGWSGARRRAARRRRARRRAAPAALRRAGRSPCGRRRRRCRGRCHRRRSRARGRF